MQGSVCKLVCDRKARAAVERYQAIVDRSTHANSDVSLGDKGYRLVASKNLVVDDLIVEVLFTKSGQNCLALKKFCNVRDVQVVQPMKSTQPECVFHDLAIE